MLERLTSQGVTIIGIDVDPRAADHASPASLDDLRDYGVRFGISYPLLFDSQRVQTAAYGVQSYPTIYAIGRDGTIRWGATGEVPLEVLEGVAAKL